MELDVDSRDAVIVEVQPPWDGRGDATRSSVARLRWVATRGVWQLSCMDGNLRWRRYDPLPESHLDVLLREIEQDPTSIFWG